MCFSLQEFVVYCFDEVNIVKMFEHVMAISPEDAYQQLTIKGFEPISWISKDGYGEYWNSTERV